METPPTAHRALQPATPVKLSLRDLVMLGAVVVSLTFAGAAWAITVRRDVSDLKADVSDLRDWARRFDASVSGALGVRTSTYGPTRSEPRDTP
jgi:hypothetical protein